MKDNREELALVLLGLIAVAAMLYGHGEIAAGCGGAIGGYLKGRKPTVIP